MDQSKTCTLSEKVIVRLLLVLRLVVHISNVLQAVQYKFKMQAIPALASVGPVKYGRGGAP